MGQYKIKSMTAFAKKESRSDIGWMSCEIRSVNHRYLEPNLRMPDELRSLEPMVREQVSGRLGRGKLDCVLKYRPDAAEQGVIQVNHRLLTQIRAADQEIADTLGINPSASSRDLLRWPGMLQDPEPDLSRIQTVLAELLDTSITDLIENRRREGERLAEIIQARCDSMRTEVNKARELMPKILESVKTRIRDRLSDVMDELDETRIEQEMALIAQRMDVDEELERLNAHLDEVSRTLVSDEPVGRRLDFLMQELNREANTLTSKSNDVDLTRVAVEMKVLIEQMREQIQNIE